MALLWTPVLNVSFAYLYPFKQRPGIAAKNNVDGAAYRWIPPGDFLMGCSRDDDECLPDESLPHTVTISKGFWLAETEGTAAAWRKVLTTVPPPAMFSWQRPEFGDSRMPVVNVSWNEARDYCAKIGGRLPTEAQWEYAARAGTDHARYGRLTDVAWYVGNSGMKPIDVNALQPSALAAAIADNRNGPHEAGANYASNAWALLDMLGNVEEWVSDDYADRTYERPYPTVDPQHRTGDSPEERRVVRGRSWMAGPAGVRLSARGWRASTYKGPEVAFRCVWDAPETTQTQ